jgi:hypothetical protein
MAGYRLRGALPQRARGNAAAPADPSRFRVDPDPSRFRVDPDPSRFRVALIRVSDSALGIGSESNRIRVDSDAAVREPRGVPAGPVRRRCASRLLRSSPGARAGAPPATPASQGPRTPEHPRHPLPPRLERRESRSTPGSRGRSPSNPRRESRPHAQKPPRLRSPGSAPAAACDPSGPAAACDPSGGSVRPALPPQPRLPGVGGPPPARPRGPGSGAARRAGPRGPGWGGRGGSDDSDRRAVGAVVRLAGGRGRADAEPPALRGAARREAD